jgi:hypothetical protein
LVEIESVTATSVASTLDDEPATKLELALTAASAASMLEDELLRVRLDV